MAAAKAKKIDFSKRVLDFDISSFDDLVIAVRNIRTQSGSKEPKSPPNTKNHWSREGMLVDILLIDLEKRTGAVKLNANINNLRQRASVREGELSKMSQFSLTMAQSGSPASREAFSVASIKAKEVFERLSKVRKNLDTFIAEFEKVCKEKIAIIKNIRTMLDEREYLLHFFGKTKHVAEKRKEIEEAIFNEIIKVGEDVDTYARNVEEFKNNYSLKLFSSPKIENMEEDLSRLEQVIIAYSPKAIFDGKKIEPARESSDYGEESRLVVVDGSD